MTGLKVSKTSLQRRRRIRSIRFRRWELGIKHCDPLCRFRLETFLKSSSAMSLTTSPAAVHRGSLVTAMPSKASTRAQRPPLDPIVITAKSHGPLHRHTTSLVSPSTSNISSPEPSRRSSDRHATSPSRRRSPSRRQSTISYFPADSPRLWSPRSPEKRSSALKRSVSLNSKKEARASTGSIPQRPVHKPAVLTLAERCVFIHVLLSCKLTIDFTQGTQTFSSSSPRKSRNVSSFVPSLQHTSQS